MRINSSKQIKIHNVTDTPKQNVSGFFLGYIYACCNLNALKNPHEISYQKIIKLVVTTKCDIFVKHPLRDKGYTKGHSINIGLIFSLNECCLAGKQPFWFIH